MSNEVVNSERYWDERFSTDWEDADGRGQSRYFAGVAQALLPVWLLQASRNHSLKWCDWGCAMGDGTSQLAHALSDITFAGVDFSAVAIKVAQQNYPDIEFLAEDWIAEAKGRVAGSTRFDVVFSSNTLEHFHRPWEVLATVSAQADKAVATLVPYQEANPIEEHHASFWPSNIPVMLPCGKVLVHMSARDVRHDQPSYWPGEQVLLVWVEPEWFAGLGIVAGQLTVDHRVAGSLKSLSDDVMALARELDQGLARLLELRADGVEKVPLLRDELRRWLMVRNQHRADLAPQWTMVGSHAASVHALQLHAALDAMAPVLAESEAVVAREAQLRELSDQSVALQEQLRASRQDLDKVSQSLAELRIAAQQADQRNELLKLHLQQSTARCDEQSDLIAAQSAYMEKMLANDELRREHAERMQAAQQQQISLQADLVAKAQWIEKLNMERAQMLESSSWRLTRPLRVMRRLLTHPTAQARGVLSWLDARGGSRARLARKLRSAGRFARRTVANGGIDPADKARLGTVIQQSCSTVLCRTGVADGPGVSIAVAGPKEDVFIWAVIDWHFRFQRPQHLAAALAKAGHRVFYISNNFVDSETHDFHVQALDESGRLFQVNLHLDGAPQIYSTLPDPAQVRQLQGSLARLLCWSGSQRTFSIVQHPYWETLARSVPSAKLVYDCMDHHAGFADNVDEVLLAEKRLVAESDLLVVTSGWLQDELSDKARNSVVIRNATEYEHFCSIPDKVFVDPAGRKVIGYYGAIAEWFDPLLVRAVALAHPDALVLLIGRDTAGVGEQLADLDNVRMEGEVAYDQLPYWVHGFDVCLLPFQVIPLTLATNPVKVYEYLSAGKPVVSVDLPEMQQFAGLVSIAADTAGFVAATGLLLSAVDSAQAAAQRQAFAACQTWAHRVADLEVALAGIQEPRVSVIVLTYNNLDLTKACLHSIETYSDYPNLELIVVDNASSDDTQSYLAQWEKQGKGRRFIANDANLGFSAGNNVGLAAATGEYLVILNNDTYVTPGWVRGLVNHLRCYPDAGLIGPVTNNIGNEARIDISYADMAQMLQKSGEYTRSHPGISFPIRTAAFFCVMLTRAAYQKVGPMDEQFGVGFFEDDDYCMRLHAEQYGVRCAEDVFVHHHLSASFNKLNAETKQALFDRNRALYEAKWGPWEPHVYRKGHQG